MRPVDYLESLVRQRTEMRVQKGPFSGLRYISDAHGSAYCPKLLGIYERELGHVIDQIIKMAPPTIVDIGAAEGYYAVGLAMRLPQTELIAFEIEELGRQQLSRLAKLNKVDDRISIREKCETDALELSLKSAGSNSVVICDVEGYESVLLDPTAVRSLQKTPILVELHDHLVPAVSNVIRKRFEATHQIESVQSEPRTEDEFPYNTLITRLLPVARLRWMVSEFRAVPMQWYWMVPKDSPAEQDWH